MQVIWYTAMSMDGRIAGPGGDLSFLSTVAGGADDDWGFETFVSRVDAVAGSGVPVTTIRIATNDREKPEFHDVVLWRQQAEFAANCMAKGRLAYIEGRLQTRTWEGADGAKRRTVEVVAERFQAMSPKEAADAAS